MKFTVGDISTFNHNAHTQLPKKTATSPVETIIIQFKKPHTEIEKCLAGIWSELLNLPQVGLDDDFFEVGGDSILSIQLVSKMRQSGLEITMEQVFEYPTLEKLASVAKKIEGLPNTTVSMEQEIVEKEIVLSPIQQWFLEQPGNPWHHYNQAVLIKSAVPVEPEVLEKSLQALLETHPNLGLRFKQTASGVWEQQSVETSQLMEYRFGICRVEDLSSLESEAALKKRLEVMEAVQQNLHITQGPLFQGVLFQGSAEGDYLFLVCHHLLIDSVSWRILLDDLELAYNQVTEGVPIKLAEERRRFGWWTSQLQDLAKTEPLQKELDYWEDKLRHSQLKLPQDFPESGSNTMESLREITLELSVMETRQLLQGVPRAYHTQVNDVLLTALSLSLVDWLGSSELSLMLEGHGREALTAEMDLSRTVGWFTSLYPIRIDLTGVENIGDALKRVKENLRSIPQKGIGYGMLKYFSQEGKNRLSLKEPEISFNYLGQWNTQNVQGKKRFDFTKGEVGSSISPQYQRPRLLEINSQVIDEVLSIHLGYSKNHHQEKTIELIGSKILENLRSIIQHCCVEKQFGYTPSDFPLAKIPQETLDRVFGKIPNIEDIYPLSPMQEGLLFQKLYLPDSKAYFVQNLFVINQSLDKEVFKNTWEFVVGHYEILRTGFKWNDLDHALQFVTKDIKLNWTEEDWKDLSPNQIQKKIDRLLQRDKETDFNYEKPPLMRFYLITVSESLCYFVWSFHHLLLDGWCSSILMNALKIVYSGLRTRQIAKLKTHKPYRIFIEWLQSYNYEVSKEFFKENMQEVSVTSLSKALPDINIFDDNNEFGNKQFCLSEEDSKLLRDFAKAQKVTLNTLFQASWALLLRYYTQQHDVVFGVVFSGRSMPIDGIENMVGLFINTLPLRINIHSQILTVKNLLEQVSIASVQLQKYSHVPLFKILNWTGIKERIDLFDTVLIFENFQSTDIEQNVSEALSLELVKAYEPTEYPLSILIVPNDRILLDISYKQGSFTEKQINKLIHHFINILLAISKNTDEKLKFINPITPEEENTILNVWNNTDILYPQNETIHGIFEAQVSKTPDQMALLYNNDHLTFKELNDKANQLAHLLLEKNICPGEAIAVSLYRSFDLVVSIFAILKIGATYVPIDQTYPVDRIKYILRDSGSKLLILSKDDKKATQFLEFPLLHIEDKILRQYSIENLSPVTSEMGADIIYTSGSTGNPKGILQSHKARLNRFYWMWKKYPFRAEDICCQKTPISFSDTIWETLGPLLKGIKLIIVPEDVVKDPLQFIELLNKYRVTRVVLVPSLLKAMVDMGEAKNLVLTSLKSCIVSGETFPSILGKRFFNLCPKSILINIYGSTEFCADGTYFEVESFSAVRKNIPIGKPISNFKIYIMDENCNLLAPGIKGEICVSGIGVAKGYLNNAELSKEKFIPNPYVSSEMHGTIFRTGDIGRFLEDGILEYLERKDSQVKIRGSRIELEEIRATLMSHIVVKDAVVIVKKTDSEDKHVVAYIITNNLLDDNDLNENKIKAQVNEYLIEKLPPFMLPSYLVLLTEFPLTPNGKIDYIKLSSDDYIKLKRNLLVTPPVTELQLKLCNLWSELLETTIDDINLNFFEMGGHSILATKLVIRLRQVLHIDLPIKIIFQYTTVYKLANYLENSTKNEDLQKIIYDIQPVSRNIQASYLLEAENDR